MGTGAGSLALLLLLLACVRPSGSGSVRGGDRGAAVEPERGPDVRDAAAPTAKPSICDMDASFVVERSPSDGMPCLLERDCFREPVSSDPCSSEKPDLAAARQALGAVDVGPCSRDDAGAHLHGHVVVTFLGSGRATGATLTGSNVSEPGVRRCVEAAFREVVVRPFRGGPAKVGYTF